MLECGVNDPREILQDGGDRNGCVGQNFCMSAMGSLLSARGIPLSVSNYIGRLYSKCNHGPGGLRERAGVEAKRSEDNGRLVQVNAIHVVQDEKGRERFSLSSAHFVVNSLLICSGGFRFDATQGDIC